MAGPIPDSRTLDSWEDAFQHPLPVVRKLEQQLRRNIDDNRQKLRSLVGASYRDLLGTAERIIEMDDQVQTVETYLGDIGQKCNARTIERISENYVRMRKTRDAETHDVRRSMAQTRVLQNCLTAATRILKAGGDALRASRLFVLCRLLYNNISETSDPPTVLQDLQRKLNMLRSRLLSFIERTLVRPTSDKAQLEHALYAYILATSSSPREVLRHFMQIRYSQLERRPESPAETDVLHMLDLYSETLLDVRELFPRRFTDGLSQLAKTSLLHDDLIKSDTELNIDIYGSWIPEHIRAFTPWLRHDQMTGSEIADALASWAKQSQLCLQNAVRDYLRSQDTARDVMNSRYKFISKFVALSGRLKSVTSVDAIQNLREAYLSRLQELASKSAALGKLTVEDGMVPKARSTVMDDPSLWNLATQDTDLRHGAMQLRQSLLRKRYGRSAVVQEGIEKLEMWLRRVNSVLEVIDDMSTTRWDEDPDFDLEELEDDESLQQLLSKDDPERLRESFRGACQQSLNDSIAELNETAASPALSMYYLRMWREIELRRRALEGRLSVPIQEMSLVALHRNIASSTSEPAIQDYVRTAKSHREPAVALWDGSPPLPTQPSPSVVKFLAALHREMSHAGGDLWTPESVLELKIVALDALSQGLGDTPSNDSMLRAELTNGHLETEEEGEGEVKTDSQVNGDTDARTVSSAQRVQNLFDMLYLARVFSTSEDSVKESNFGGVLEASREGTLLDDAALQRLGKNAGDYWKRTYLLYGLLAPDSSMGRH